MRKFLSFLVLLGLTSSLALAAAPEGGGEGNGEGNGKKADASGLVAHYFKDAVEWDGAWAEGVKPTVEAAKQTFTEYRYSRIEPLINHLFVRCGWFSVRWVGDITIPCKKADAEAAEADGNADVDVSFEFWADDGARLVIDGKTIIDDWKACSEKDEESHRKATVALTPGKHRIVVEYFQGESLKKKDRDPAKLYWASAKLGIKLKIIPASAFSHTEADLEDFEVEDNKGKDEDKGKGKDEDKDKGKDEDKDKGKDK